MDYNADWNAARTNRDQSNSSGDFRISFESENEWADLEQFRRRSLRPRYTERQLRADPDYSGMTDCWSDEEARAILEELLKRFPLHGFHGMALPPTGLPGVMARDMEEDDLPARMLALGLRYAEALIRNEGRAIAQQDIGKAA